MKTKHQFLIILMLLISYGLSAQIKVNSNGNVAVGYSSNVHKFAVLGSVYSSSYIYSSSNIYSSRSIYCTGITPKNGYGTITIGSNSSSYNSLTPTMKIDNKGEFNNRNALEVNGDILFNGGTPYTSSDRKFKKKIKKINGSSILDRIQNLDAKEYKFKSEKELLDVQRAGLSTYKQDTLDLQEEALKMLKNNMGKHPYYGKKVEKLNQKGIDSLIQIKYIRRVKKKYSILDSLDNNKIVVVDIPKMDTARVNFGFLAQEVEPIFPNLVKMDSTTGMYAVNYMGFIPINYSAIKALKAENDELRTELEAMKAEILEIKKALQGKKFK